MKIDVEGTESAVLDEGRALLHTLQPDILCEVLHGVAEAPAVQRHLDPHGYRYYLIRDRSLEFKTSIQPDREARDWLFTLRSPDELRNAFGLTISGDT